MRFRAAGWDWLARSSVVIVMLVAWLPRLRPPHRGIRWGCHMLWGWQCGVKHNMLCLQLFPSLARNRLFSRSRASGFSQVIADNGCGDDVRNADQRLCQVRPYLHLEHGCGEGAASDSGKVAREVVSLHTGSTLDEHLGAVCEGPEARQGGAEPRGGKGDSLADGGGRGEGES